MVPAVVCAGIVVADLFVPPLTRLPAPGELLTTPDFLLASGGCAVNTAACLVKLGVAVRVVGKVGRDSFGDFIEVDLRRKEIDTAGLMRSAAQGTSKTVILPVAGEDRRYIHTVGANAALSATDVDRALLAGARVLYLGGYGVLPGLHGSDLADLLRFARAAGLHTVLDVVIPAGGAPLSLAELGTVLPHVDAFLPNAEEAQALTGEATPQAQAERFLALGCQTTIITLGREGALLVTDELIVEAPAPSVEVVDGSGAGDAFAAGLIVGLLEGWSMPRSLGFASVAGASACTQLGCLAGVFTRAQAEAYLAAHPLDLLVQRRVTPSLSRSEGIR